MKLDATDMRSKADTAAKIAKTLETASAEADKYGDANRFVVAALDVKAEGFREEETAWQEAVELMEAAQQLRQIADSPPGNPLYITEVFQRAVRAAADGLDRKAEDNVKKAEDNVNLYVDHRNEP